MARPFPTRSAIPMKTSRVAILGLTLAGFGLYLSNPNPAPADTDIADQMVKKAVEYLKKSASGGGWEYNLTRSPEDNIGLTALAGLALNESKIDGSQRLVQQAAAYIKSNIGKLGTVQALGVGRTTYSLSFAVIFLDRI